MRIKLFLAAALVAAISITGCKKDHFGPSGGRYNPGGNKPEEVKIEENPDWTVTYLGRNDFTETDGTVSRVEEFRFKYTGNNWFIVRSLQEGVLQDAYDGSLKDFFTAEAKAVVNAAGDGKWYENNNNAFDKSQTGTVAFDLLFHGNYVTYIIEMNARGNITGKYAKVAHEVEEEVAVANYTRWIGTWDVTGPDTIGGTSTYHITISPVENNYFYRVDGWETGKVPVEMNDPVDWIYTRYNKKDGNMYFYGQFICAYIDPSLDENKEELGDVDEMFVGTFINGTQGETVDGEGADYQLDIAHTTQVGDDFSIEPEILQFCNDKTGEITEIPVKYLRYTRYVYKNDTWAHYNDKKFIPQLPLTMTRIEVIQGPVKPHAVAAHPSTSKKHMQRGALKVHTPKTSR